MPLADPRSPYDILSVAVDGMTGCALVNIQNRENGNELEVHLHAGTDTDLDAWLAAMPHVLAGPLVRAATGVLGIASPVPDPDTWVRSCYICEALITVDTKGAVVTAQNRAYCPDHVPENPDTYDGPLVP